MTVKEIICDALLLLGRSDVVEEYSHGNAMDVEKRQAVKTLLYCFNAVADELARAYFPLKTRERVNVNDGKISVFGLERKPVRILSVESDGRKVNWRVYPEYIRVDANDVVVEYEYCPEEKSENDDAVFGDVIVGARTVVYGMASEYCLINGEIESANAWESKYRQEIDKALCSQKVRGRIPPRRWV